MEDGRWKIPTPKVLFRQYTIVSDPNKRPDNCQISDFFPEVFLKPKKDLVNHFNPVCPSDRPRSGVSPFQRSKWQVQGQGLDRLVEDYVHSLVALDPQVSKKCRVPQVGATARARSRREQTFVASLRCLELPRF
eukprot:1195259-Prorocentrum_minimum.AAC.3